MGLADGPCQYPQLSQYTPLPIPIHLAATVPHQSTPIGTLPPHGLVKCTVLCTVSMQAVSCISVLGLFELHSLSFLLIFSSPSLCLFCSLFSLVYYYSWPSLLVYNISRLLYEKQTHPSFLYTICRDTISRGLHCFPAPWDSSSPVSTCRFIANRYQLGTLP